MSYVSWHICGYGICVSDIEDLSVERLEKLIAMAPIFQKDVQEWLTEREITEPTVEDYLEYAYDQDLHLGLAPILQEVILEAENVDLVACNDFYNAEYLLCCPSYPWSHTEYRQLPTEEAADELFRKYVSVLTDQEIETDYRSVENGG